MRTALDALLVGVLCFALASVATAQARFPAVNALATYISASNGLTEVSATTPLPVGR